SIAHPHSIELSLLTRVIITYRYASTQAFDSPFAARAYRLRGDFWHGDARARGSRSGPRSAAWTFVPDQQQPEPRPGIFHRSAYFFGFHHYWDAAARGCHVARREVPLCHLLRARLAKRDRSG